jgi:hypothetical protein
MTSKEKANDLVEKFSKHAKYWDCFWDEPLNERHDVQCAIIAVEEILKTMVWNQGVEDPTYCYWQEVKQHLEEML